MFIVQPCFADFDVNAISGTVTINGESISQGTVIIENLGNEGKFSTEIDGENIAPFMKGRGRYDTGDIPEFSTGDMVIVFLKDNSELGIFEVQLTGGTTNLDLELVSPKNLSIRKNHEVDRGNSRIHGLIRSEARLISSDFVPDVGAEIVRGTDMFMVINSIFNECDGFQEEIVMEFDTSRREWMNDFMRVRDFCRKKGSYLGKLVISGFSKLAPALEYVLLLLVLTGCFSILLLFVNREGRADEITNTHIDNKEQKSNRPFWDNC